MVILMKTFEELFSKYKSVYTETDMRSVFNPTRMNVIEKVTEQLVEKIKSVCPNCKIPGFRVTNTKKGHKCSLCGAPTNAPLSYIYACQHCQFTKEGMYPNRKMKVDPMYHDYCNP